MSGEMARTFHVQFATTSSPDSLDYAARLYRAYVDGFPDAPDHAEAQAAYAETLWSRAATEQNPRLQPDRWASAAEAFMAASEDTTDPRRAAEAASAGVLAWRNGLDPASPPDRVNLAAAARARPNPQRIPPRDAKVLAALAGHAGALADGDSVVQTALFAASVYRRYGHPELAIPLLIAVVEQHRDHPGVESAANLLLDSLVRAQRYDEVLGWVDRLAADGRWLDDKPALRDSIKFLRSHSLRRR